MTAGVEISCAGSRYLCPAHCQLHIHITAYNRPVPKILDVRLGQSGLGLWLNWMTTVDSHGRMVEPPARNTMWRMDFNTPENYDDTELFCGGLKVTHEDNGGKCGLCGDRYDMRQPRPHESGGNFTSNVIGRVYQPGRVVDVMIDIVANHKGYFEFSLCERDDPLEKETEECFDKRILQLADGTGTKFFIPKDDNGFYMIPVKIPEDVSCAYCVFRWHWRSANNWGDCDNDTKAVGCGPQEIYRNCADIAVLAGAGIRGNAAFNPRVRGPKALKKHPKNPLKDLLHIHHQHVSSQ